MELLNAQVEISRGKYASRPHPKKLFTQVAQLVACGRWSEDARELGEPFRNIPAATARV